LLPPRLASFNSFCLRLPGLPPRCRSAVSLPAVLRRLPPPAASAVVPAASFTALPLCTACRYRRFSFLCLPFCVFSPLAVLTFLCRSYLVVLPLRFVAWFAYQRGWIVSARLPFCGFAYLLPACSACLPAARISDWFLACLGSCPFAVGFCRCLAPHLVAPVLPLPAVSSFSLRFCHLLPAFCRNVSARFVLLLRYLLFSPAFCRFCLPFCHLRCTVLGPTGGYGRTVTCVKRLESADPLPFSRYRLRSRLCCLHHLRSGYVSGRYRFSACRSGACLVSAAFLAATLFLGLPFLPALPRLYILRSLPFCAACRSRLAWVLLLPSHITYLDCADLPSPRILPPADSALTILQIRSCRFLRAANVAARYGFCCRRCRCCQQFVLPLTADYRISSRCCTAAPRLRRVIVACLPLAPPPNTSPF